MGDAKEDMTVFGFGRSRSSKYLTQIPAHYILGLMDSTAFASSAEVIDAPEPEETESSAKKNSLLRMTRISIPPPRPAASSSCR